jgi:hypothetical protein
LQPNDPAATLTRSSLRRYPSLVASRRVAPRKNVEKPGELRCGVRFWLLPQIKESLECGGDGACRAHACCGRVSTRCWASPGWMDGVEGVEGVECTKVPSYMSKVLDMIRETAPEPLSLVSSSSPSSDAAGDSIGICYQTPSKSCECEPPAASLPSKTVLPHSEGQAYPGSFSETIPSGCPSRRHIYTK